MPAIAYIYVLPASLMRHYTTILFLFFSTAAFTQSVDKEIFINQVYQKLVDSSYPYYLLSEKAYKINYSELSFGIKLPDSIIRQMEQNYLLDTTEQVWNYLHLDKAKKIEADSIGVITGSTLRIYSMNSWSKRRKKREEIKQLDASSKIREKMPIYDKKVYFFSNPVFDNTKTFAIIQMGYSCGFNCSYHCTYRFELIDNKWTLVSTGTCVAS